MQCNYVVRADDGKGLGLHSLRRAGPAPLLCYHFTAGEINLSWVHCKEPTLQKLCFTLYHHLSGGDTCCFLQFFKIYQHNKIEEMNTIWEWISNVSV